MVTERRRGNIADAILEAMRGWSWLWSFCLTWGCHPGTARLRLREDAQGIAGSAEKNFLGDGDVKKG